MEHWLDPDSRIQSVPTSSDISWKPKCPDVPVLEAYDLPPDNEFWRRFPVHPLSQLPSSPVDPDQLEAAIAAVEPALSFTQKYRMLSSLHDIRHGYKTPLLYKLPPLRSKNSPSVLVFGKQFTDSLAWWIQNRYVAGPFHAPPLDDFRVNTMMAVEQKEKIRIIMDLSVPDGESLNDAIDEDELERLYMSTARFFGYSVVESGPGARMWKFDFVDAYKNIPAHTSDRRLQGFTWLGKFFIETQQVFGSKSAVSAFDRLGHTLVDIALLKSGTPGVFLHRTLDDVLLVTPAHSAAGPKFAEVYKALCQQVGARLAPLDPEAVKTFEDKTSGTALGIGFDTSELTWSISDAKREKILTAISDSLAGSRVTLQDMQSLMGLLNDFSQMCPFLRAFRFSLTKDLRYLSQNPSAVLDLSAQSKTDLKVWAMVVTHADPLPIPHRPLLPSLKALTFVSDAAGARFAKVNGRFIPYTDQQGIGAASISAVEDGPVWFHASVTWPEYLLLKARDSEDHAYGCKSPTLEAIGAMLPFLCCPHKLINRDVLLLTDNMAVVFGWDSRRVPHDESASIVLQAIHLIANYLGCAVTIQHLPRTSTESAVLADNLTRASTTTDRERAMLKDAESLPIPTSLTRWLENPSEDWSLPRTLLKHVQETLRGLNRRFL